MASNVPTLNNNSPPSSGEIGPERAGAPPQTSPLPPERELR